MGSFGVSVTPWPERGSRWQDVFLGKYGAYVTVEVTKWEQSSAGSIGSRLVLVP